MPRILRCSRLKARYTASRRKRTTLYSREETGCSCRSVSRTGSSDSRPSHSTAFPWRKPPPPLGGTPSPGRLRSVRSWASKYSTGTLTASSCEARPRSRSPRSLVGQIPTSASSSTLTRCTGTSHSAAGRRTTSGSSPTGRPTSVDSRARRARPPSTSRRPSTTPSES